MTDDNSNQSNQRWMPTAAGVLCIVSGSLGLLSKLGWSLFSSLLALHVSGFTFRILGIILLFSAIFDIGAIIGGIFALQHRNWGLSLAGAISTLLAGSWLFGALSIIFISLSRKEFK